ncbi:hypothetical protein [Streptomyces nitrosporeus]|uniref:hypothetical protein n=1 Tax=Streptomyces nitrosporeus TaxID=28894 RepID=UPI0039A25388
MPEWIAYVLIAVLTATGTARVLAVAARHTRPLGSEWIVCTHPGCSDYEFETQHHVTAAGLRCATCRHLVPRR